MPLTTYAASVHKWVDENGVTHYSDQAPEHYVAQVDEIKISNNYSQSNAQDDYYSVSNQWARMHAERVARKKLQLEKAKLKQSQSEVTPQVVYFNQDEDSSGQGYYPVFANSFGRFGNKYYSNGFRKSFNNNYNGRNCKLPRNSKIRTGLSLTIR
ncbi:MAG: DUF4124 domain-containing protein [Pseudomonadota bacterium]